MSTEKPFNPQPKQNVRIKADCAFHGMVGYVRARHGDSCEVQIPWACLVDGSLSYVSVWFSVNQLWPAESWEYDAAKDTRRLQEPQERSDA